MILPPVNPLPENLPLNDSNWSWENFEAFCHDLISQFGTTKNANRYGFLSIVFDLERTNQLNLLPDKDLVDLCPPIEPYQVTKNPV